MNKVIPTTKEEFDDFLKSYAFYVTDHLFLISQQELLEKEGGTNRLFNFFCKHLLLIQPNEDYNLYTKKQKAWFNTVMNNLMFKHANLLSGFVLDSIKNYKTEFKEIEKQFRETGEFNEKAAKRAMFIYEVFVSMISNHFKEFTKIVKETKVK